MILHIILHLYLFDSPKTPRWQSISWFANRQVYNNYLSLLHIPRESEKRISKENSHWQVSVHLQCKRQFNLYFRKSILDPIRIKKLPSMHPCKWLHHWFALQSHLSAHRSPYIFFGHWVEQLSPNVPFGHSMINTTI